MTTTNVKVLLPNVTISACKLRRSYINKFGNLQYGVLLSGDALAKSGLKLNAEGQYWHNQNAKYGSMDIDVPPVSIQDIHGNEIEDDLEDGSVAHVHLEKREYPAGKSKDGRSYPAGVSYRVSAVRAVSFSAKRSKQDELTAALLELGIDSDSEVVSDPEF